MSQDQVRARAMGEPEAADLEHARRQRDSAMDVAAFQSERAYKSNMRALDYERQRDLARDVAQALEEENALLTWLLAESEWKRRLVEAKSWARDQAGKPYGGHMATGGPVQGPKSDEPLIDPNCDYVVPARTYRRGFSLRPAPSEPTPQEPRVWLMGDAEPHPDVTRIRDRHGREFTRESEAYGGRWLRQGGDPLHDWDSWQGLVTWSDPLTEVPSEPTGGEA